MAVKSSATITLSTIRDIQSVTWYYLLQPSTAAAPSKPTTLTPPTITTTGYSGWSDSEPTYTSGDTRTLYITERTIYTDGTFEYSVPSCSSSYEASKAAYNKALEAAKTATNYLSSDASGIMVADQRNGTETPSTATTRNVFIDSDSVDIRNGKKILATFGTEVSIMSESGTELAHFGYAETNKESSTGSAPYYTLGYRNNAYLTYTPTRTYKIGDKVKYNNEYYVCIEDITEAEAWTSTHWIKILTPKIGSYSLAEGYDTMAVRMGDHAEGRDTFAQGSYAHAEGYGTVAATESSNALLAAHAEGIQTVADATCAHAEGHSTHASGYASHAGGYYTVADKSYQTAVGKYNTKANEGSLFVVGNGTSSKRSDAFAVYDDGRIIAPFFAGFIQMFAGTTAPVGWLLCDGAAVSRTVYAQLFAVIGTTFGAGDGSTTFNLPDFRDRFPVGAGSTYSRNSKGGANTVTLSTNQIPAHTHGKSGAITSGITGGSHSHTFEYKGDASSSLSGSNPDGTGSVMRRKDPTAQTGLSTAANTHTHNLPAHEHTSVGGGQAHENRPPYIGINFIICTGEAV